MNHDLRGGVALRRDGLHNVHLLIILVHILLLKLTLSISNESPFIIVYALFPKTYTLEYSLTWLLKEY
jgi:hypothetical protein